MYNSDSLTLSLKNNGYILMYQTDDSVYEYTIYDKYGNEIEIGSTVDYTNIESAITEVLELAGYERSECQEESVNKVIELMNASELERGYKEYQTVEHLYKNGYIEKKSIFSKIIDKIHDFVLDIQFKFGYNGKDDY